MLVVHRPAVLRLIAAKPTGVWGFWTAPIAAYGWAWSHRYWGGSAGRRLIAEQQTTSGSRRQATQRSHTARRRDWAARGTQRLRDTTAIHGRAYPGEYSSNCGAVDRPYRVI